MRKFLISFIIGLALSGCGGGGGGGTTDTSTPATSYSFSPGLYTGSFTDSIGTDSYAILITSNNKWAGADPTEAATGTVSGGNLSTSVFSATLTSATGGTFNNSGNTGTFSMTSHASLYNRSSSLAKLDGTWVDDVYTDNTGTVTVTFNNGAMSMSTTSGCAATGSVSTIDTSKNEYSVTMTVTNCGGFNGTYTGYGFTDDDTFTDDQFVMALDNADSWAVFAPIKQ